MRMRHARPTTFSASLVDVCVRQRRLDARGRDSASFWFAHSEVPSMQVRRKARGMAASRGKASRRRLGRSGERLHGLRCGRRSRPWRSRSAARNCRGIADGRDIERPEICSETLMAKLSPAASSSPRCLISLSALHSASAPFREASAWPSASAVAHHARAVVEGA
jgi:hypothetical protein